MTKIEPTTPRPPDRPLVPRAPRTLWAKLMVGFAVAVTLGYAAEAYTQHEFSEPERDEVPASVRSSPGGYRSYAFWHSGYHGGK